ncbi:MAG: HlyD family efflux transporter periplasmic adaptor subunit [Verrucomicrobiales bacterium]|nr:HlyD family efflux transporter periplasmic adaptor subunit [Verrucomicrobiales bacterium]
MKPGVPILALLGAVALTGCEPKADPNPGWPGYLESEVIQIAAPEAGYLADLKVRRGEEVAAEAVLFQLDAPTLGFEKDAAGARQEAGHLKAQDAAQGERLEVVRKLQANLRSGEVALDLARKELKRVQGLVGSNAVAREQLDRAQAEAEEQEGQVEALRAELDLAQQGQRALQVQALEQEAEALKANLSAATWRDQQTVRKAPPVPTRVLDTLFQPGEWVPAGQPVVLLRRSDELRVRFFADPEAVAGLSLGQQVRVRLPGEAEAVRAQINRIADEAEYTPPVIYSREQAARLVILVEAELEPKDAARLHPGLPVTVELQEGNGE